MCACSAAFPFFYIEPSKAENVHITKKFTGEITQKQLEEIAPIGNSPTFMTFEDMKKVMPTWMNVSIAVFKDQEANSVWGWVQVRAACVGVPGNTVGYARACQLPWSPLPCAPPLSYTHRALPVQSQPQEMYGFTIALWLNGIKHVDLFLNMQAQPPWDQEMHMANGEALG